MTAYAHHQQRLLAIVVAGLFVITALIGTLLAQRFLALDLIPDLHLEFDSEGRPIGGTEPGEEKRRPPLPVRTSRQVPAISQNDFDKKLEVLKGYPVIVNFWASWCGPCRDEAPHLARLAQAYEHRKVAFIGINVNDHGESASAFIKENRIEYPNYADSGRKIAATNRVTALPTTLVIDASGSIKARYVGAVDPKELSSRISQIISDASAPGNERRPE